MTAFLSAVLEGSGREYYNEWQGGMGERVIPEKI